MRLDSPAYGPARRDDAPATPALWAARAALVAAVAIIAAADAALAPRLQFDPFLYAQWFIVPVGAIALGGLAAASYVAVCRQFDARPRPIDLPLLMTALLALPLLILAGEYLEPVVSGHASLRDLRPFGDFVARSVTDVVLTVHAREWGTASAPVGEFGWFQLVPRLAALLALAKIAHVAAASRPRR